MTALSLRNPIAVLMICIGLVVFAGVVTPRMPVDTFPELTPPVLIPRPSPLWRPPRRSVTPVSRMSAPDRIDLSNACEHVTEAMPRKVHRPPPGCVDCLKIGGRWVHLRVCLSCGHVGCCDSSPNRHATAHNRSTGHPVITSGEVGETWAYCYADDQFLSSE